PGAGALLRRGRLRVVPGRTPGDGPVLEARGLARVPGGQPRRGSDGGADARPEPRARLPDRVVGLRVPDRRLAVLAMGPRRATPRRLAGGSPGRGRDRWGHQSGRCRVTRL